MTVINRPDRLGRARAATFGLFALTGLVMGTWVVQIPAIERQARLDHAVLGGLLLLLGAGAFAGMQLTGPLVDRLGARRVAPPSAVACCLTLVLPGAATDSWVLGVALLLFGLGNGCLDVAMNAHAVQVERRLGRPAMSAFHATFSLGGAAAALLAAGTSRTGVSPVVVFGAVAALGLLVAASAGPLLLSRDPSPPGTRSRSRRPARRRTSPRVWALAALAMALMLAEGVANDWSALHLSSVLGAPAGTAALAYGGFAVAMTVGRLVADRITARVGPAAVLGHGAALAALAMVVVVLAPSASVAVIGWTLFGLGLSGCIPQLFSAAGGDDPASSATNVARVAGLGYLGMLAGPAVVGPLTHVVPLDVTFLLPAVLCALAAAAARPVTRTVAPAPSPTLPGTAGCRP